MANQEDGGGGAYTPPASIPPTKGFKVDPEALLRVAELVKKLHEDVAGDTNAPGNLQTYTVDGKGDALSDTNKGLGKFAASADQNIFAKSYGDVYKGILKTYNDMKIQLTNLENACRTTAQQYQHHDDAATSNVTQSGEY